LTTYFPQPVEALKHRLTFTRWNHKLCTLKSESSLLTNLRWC